MHKRIRDVRVLLENLRVNLNRALAEFFTLFSPLVLTNRPNELIREVFCDLVATDLKEAIHVSDIPVLVWSNFVD